jgi:hypothetical protein
MKPSTKDEKITQISEARLVKKMKLTGTSRVLRKMKVTTSSATITKIAHACQLLPLLLVQSLGFGRLVGQHAGWLVVHGNTITGSHGSGSRRRRTCAILTN